MVAGFADVKDGIEIGCLSGGGEERGHAAFQSRDFGRYGIAGGILQPCVEISFCLQVKKLAHFVGGVVFEGSALHNRKRTGFALGRGIACVQTFCFRFEFTHGILCPFRVF